MHRLECFIGGLVLLAIFAVGCGKTQTAVPASHDTGEVVQTEDAPVVADSGSRVERASPPEGEVSRIERETVANSATQVISAAAAPMASDVPIQYLDTRLQDGIRSFLTTSNRVNREMMASDLIKLADAGVPRPQIASALGYLFRNENSVDVKTDILGTLGDMDDPSAFDQIVPGLDQHQSDEVHAAAIEALDSLGDKRAIPLIQPFLTDRDGDVRDAAKSAIDSLSD